MSYFYAEAQCTGTWDCSVLATRHSTYFTVLVVPVPGTRKQQRRRVVFVVVMVVLRDGNEAVGNGMSDGTFQVADPPTFHSLTYSEIVRLVGYINFDAAADKNHGSVLPPEICRKVADFFSICIVRHDEVGVVAASSSSGPHPLESVLLLDTTATRSSWWISAHGSMPRGRGEQYLQFCLDPTRRMRRCHAVSIMIPTMPTGPCSLWEFRIDYLQHESPVWKSHPASFTLNQRRDFQKQVFVNPIDAVEIRVVCLSNQMNRWFASTDENTTLYSQVGFFAIKFE